MKRIVATTLLSMAFVCGSVSAVHAADASKEPMVSAQVAADQARAEAARQLRVSADEFTVVSIESAEWSDSSLGCRKPGAMYTQVISNGYTVVLERQGQRTHVNVVGPRALICNTAGRFTGTLRRPKTQ